MQEKHIFVTDIKLAAILLALGIPIRRQPTRGVFLLVRCD